MTRRRLAWTVDPPPFRLWSPLDVALERPCLAGSGSPGPTAGVDTWTLGPGVCGAGVEEPAGLAEKHSGAATVSRLGEALRLLAGACEKALRCLGDAADDLRTPCFPPTDGARGSRGFQGLPRGLEPG